MRVLQASAEFERGCGFCKSSLNFGPGGIGVSGRVLLTLFSVQDGSPVAAIGEAASVGGFKVVFGLSMAGRLIPVAPFTMYTHHNSMVVLLFLGKTRVEIFGVIK